jgi:hypothetical protein
VITLPPTTITTFSLREYYEFLFSFFFRHFEKVVKVVVVVRGTPPHVHRHLLRGVRHRSGEQPRGADGHRSRGRAGLSPQPSASHGYSKGPGGVTDKMERACTRL